MISNVSDGLRKNGTRATDVATESLGKCVVRILESLWCVRIHLQGNVLLCKDRGEKKN